MFEIRQRVTAVIDILASPTIPLFKHETGFLHLRHICELIAIACLAAQGDYETRRAFTEEYSPPKIFNALRALYPSFFPQPCTLESIEGHHHLTANNVEGAYQEDDITKLWNVAGSHLHRTAISKYLKTTFSPPPDLNPLHTHLRGLTRLLNQHLVPIQFGQADGTRVLLHVEMANQDGGISGRFLRIDLATKNLSVEEYHTSFA